MTESERELSPADSFAREPCVAATVHGGVRNVDSTTARYQQYVQSISDIQDLVQKATSSQLAWVSLIVDVQKSTLELYETALAASARSSVLPQLSDATAKYVLQSSQGWWLD